MSYFTPGVLIGLSYPLISLHLYTDFTRYPTMSSHVVVQYCRLHYVTPIWSIVHAQWFPYDMHAELFVSTFCDL